MLGVRLLVHHALLNVIARKSRVADSGVTPLDGHLDRDVARKKSWGFWILGVSTDFRHIFMHFRLL